MGGGQLLRQPDESDKWTADGWFRTGDVVTIDAEGYVRIADRTKDLIKSGGEWISSVDLENALMGHPAVAEAAVIAIPHPKWQERPLAAVVLKAGAHATGEELREYLARASPSGSCRRPSCSSKRSRGPRWANSRRRRCASSSPNWKWES